MLLNLLPVTNCHTSDPYPSSATYFMDGPYNPDFLASVLSGRPFPYCKF